MVSSIAWLVARTPLPLAAALAWVGAWGWWLVVPVRRGLAVANFQAAFPGLAPGPVLRRAMRGLFLGYCELLRELHRPGTVEVAIEGAEAITERARRGQGTLLLAGHFGSWDLLGPLLCKRTGIATTVIVKVPRSAAVAGLMERVRLGFGLGLLANDHGVMPRIYELLDAGQLVVFVLDQRLARGLAVPFFGRPALTAPSLAAAAAKTGHPVHFLEYWREGTGRHGARFTGPLATTGRAADDTAAFTAAIEDAIRRRPHNWLWLHDRWKGAPPAA
jgi:KDO2-lipid IV(A) lauroyltransferase